MDRRDFCKTFLSMPFLASLFGISKQRGRGFELQLISSSPHRFILPILEEVQKMHPFWSQNFTTVNYHPQQEELIKVLSKKHWKFVRTPSQAGLIFTFCRLLQPVLPSFTLIKNERAWDIRSKNLFSLWQEMNESHQPSSWLTIVSLDKKQLQFYRGTSASVYINGRKVERLSLKKSYSRSFTTHRGRIEVVVERGTAHIADSSCPQKICLHTPPVAYEGERIICVPNHFLLEIESYHSVDTAIG